MVITIASEKVKGLAWSSSGTNREEDVYAVKKEGENKWTLLYGDIKRFEYQPGFEYKVKISVTTTYDPNIADSLSVEYVLLDLISKEKKDSEGVPENFIPSDWKQSR